MLRTLCRAQYDMAYSTRPSQSLVPHLIARHIHSSSNIYKKSKIAPKSDIRSQAARANTQDNKTSQSGTAAQDNARNRLDALFHAKPDWIERFFMAVGKNITLLMRSQKRTVPITDRKQRIKYLDADRSKAYRIEEHSTNFHKDDLLPYMDPMNIRARNVLAKLMKATPAPYPWLNSKIAVVKKMSSDGVVYANGNMFIRESLFWRTRKDNDEQLAAVIAHEYAHSLARHSLEKEYEKAKAEAIVAAYTLGAASALTGLAPLPLLSAPVIAIVTGWFVVAGYAYTSRWRVSRRCEFEADSIAMTVTAKAKIHPSGAYSFWHNWYHSARKYHIKQSWAEATHPADSDRLNAMTAQLPFAESIYNRSTKSKRK